VKKEQTMKRQVCFLVDTNSGAVSPLRGHGAKKSRKRRGKRKGHKSRAKKSRKGRKRGKLTGAAKRAFLARMKRGRKAASAR
jgi:hypothetical protein